MQPAVLDSMVLVCVCQDGQESIATKHVPMAYMEQTAEADANVRTGLPVQGIVDISNIISSIYLLILSSLFLPCYLFLLLHFIFIFLTFTMYM